MHSVLKIDNPLREERLQRFIEQLRANWSYATNKLEMEAVIAFVSSDQTAQPVISMPWCYADILTLLNDNPEYWNAYDDRLMRFITKKRHWQSGSYDGFAYYFYHHWLTPKLQANPKRPFFETLTTRLVQYGSLEAGVVERICEMASPFFVVNGQISGVGEYAVGRIEPFFASVYKTSDSASLLDLLLRSAPTVADKHLLRLLEVSSDYADEFTINATCVRVLLERDARKYEPLVAKLLPKLTYHENLSAVLSVLIELVPATYGGREVEQAYWYFDTLRKQAGRTTSQLMYTAEYDPKLQKYVPVYQTHLGHLLDLEEPAKAWNYLLNWLNDVVYYPVDMLPPIVDRYGQGSVGLLMTWLKTGADPFNQYIAQYHRTFLQLLSTLDYSAYSPQIWALTRHKAKQMREMAAVTLAKLGDAAIPEAEKLLNDKKADARQTGTLILSLIGTDRAREVLMNALNAEKNDDARDLMLDSLAGVLPVPTTEAEVAAMVEKTRRRGKLDAPVAPYLPEKELPVLYWRASGGPLDANTVRFLLYRQSRAKDIRPDAEARPVYALIDRQRSAPFANAVLTAYVNAGADPKGKGCLTVGAMLGGDDEIDLLRTKINQWVDANRGKMAEYAVQALALIGSNRALRAVEFYARKYKSKNKNIGAAANEAFAIAAETLGVSPYDLADSIIPDFGFEGLFREFEAGGETYRAFVGTDFKLAFLDEDNKLSKTVPKAASTALKGEFKDIGKEIRDIVKAQSGRLEQYLVTQRKWPAEQWQTLFMGNPVMFVYAVRLIWGAFDDQQRLLFTFQCQEDQTLMDEWGDEMQLSTRTQIGMVHPLSLTADQITYWSDQLADAGVDSIFSQLARRVVVLPDEARSLTIDRQFDGIEYGGYGFVGKLEKVGWVRGSVQDAGGIASYYKNFSEPEIMAILTQEGELSIGYYDGNAVLGRLMFVRSGSVRFGNYVYDEPANETDPRLIPFGEVPPIVYSEVMADLLFFKENDVKKTAQVIHPKDG